MSLLVLVFAVTVRIVDVAVVVGQHRMRNGPVADQLDGAVVVLQQLGCKLDCVVAMDGAIHAHDTLYIRGDGANVVGHNYYGHTLI